MREIKFRVWHRYSKRMVSHNELRKLLLDTVLCAENLMQYTGLKDKNGKEIYEGDIIFQAAEGYRTTGIVKLSDDLRWIVGSHYIPCLSIYDKYRELLGNIYENPELLGE